jgi:hypothetical protein
MAFKGVKMKKVTQIIPATGWMAVYAEDVLISKPLVAWCLATDDVEDEDGFDYCVFGQTCNKKNVDFEHAENFLGYMHESENIDMYWGDFIKYIERLKNKV